MEQVIGSAPEHICDLFQGSAAGCVEMVNSRGIYLRVGDSCVLLCSSRFGTVPNGAALEQWERLPSLIEPGQPFRTENGIVAFPAASWQMCLQRIPKDAQVRLPDAASLNTGIRLLKENAKQTGLSSLVFPLFAEQAPPMNPYCHMALPYVQTLLRSLQKENAAGIEEAVSGLLGLGPGLTPSGDDLLSGLLYGLRHSPARDLAASKMLSNAICALAGERTNAVSADYLLALAKDAPFDRMAQAWTDPGAGAMGLMEIGSNSGGEMLLGLLCAGSLCIEA